MAQHMTLLTHDSWALQILEAPSLLPPKKKISQLQEFQVISKQVYLLLSFYNGCFFEIS